MKKLGTLLVLLAAGMFIAGTTGCGDKTDSKKSSSAADDSKDDSKSESAE